MFITSIACRNQISVDLKTVQYKYSLKVLDLHVVKDFSHAHRSILTEKEESTNSSFNLLISLKTLEYNSTSRYCTTYTYLLNFQTFQIRNYTN